MNDLISRQAAIDAAVKMFEAWYGGSVLRDREIRARFDVLPSAQSETQKLLDDGTLIVYTDIDIIKITRVNITQNNTHYGGLFYRDEE